MATASVTATKVCSSCHQEKPTEDFHRNRTTKDGLGSWCRACHKARTRAYEIERSARRKVQRHARGLLSTGKPETLLKDRFERKFIRRSDNECWPWIGAIHSRGHGSIFVKREGGKSVAERAHRVAYSLYVCGIPDGLHVLHRCDNPCCVNPAHLFLGTHDDNMLDKRLKGREEYPPRTRGQDAPLAKFTNAQVAEIRRRRAVGEGNNALAREYEVCPMTISNICRNKIYRE